MSALRATVAARAGMSAGDLECLLTLVLEGPLTAGQLGDRAGLTSGAVTGVVDRLERAGYVRRERDPGDRRRVIVTPDPERVEREIAPLFAPFEAALAEVRGGYGDAELALVTDFLTRSAPVVAAEAARLREPSGVAAAPLAGVPAGRLEFGSAAARVTLRADATLGDLYRARFEGPVPTVRVREGTVTVHYRRSGLFDWGKHHAELTLNSTIPWEILARGGMSNIRGELATLDLRALTASGGVNEVELDLGRPHGTVPIRASGGVSHLVLRRPAGVPVRVAVSGGATSVALDGEKYGALGRQKTWSSPGYDASADRYDIAVTGGASSLEIVAV